MPLLKLEPDLQPDDLFDLPPERYPWWVVHVRSRQEKLLARECRSRGVPFYLPLREQKLVRAGRRRTSWLPLFPGYVFIRGDLEHERLEALRTNLCVKVLEVLDQESIAADLAQVRRLQESGLPLVAHPELTKGSLVRIAWGAFAGMTGRIARLRGKDRFVVAVRFIHRSVSVEVDRDALEPEAPPKPAPRPSRR